MKTKAMVLSCLVGTLVLFVCYGYGSAKTKAEPITEKIGVVNIRKVFRDSKKNAKYMTYRQLKSEFSIGFIQNIFNP